MQHQLQKDKNLTLKLQNILVLQVIKTIRHQVNKCSLHTLKEEQNRESLQETVEIPTNNQVIISKLVRLRKIQKLENRTQDMEDKVQVIFHQSQSTKEILIDNYSLKRDNKNGMIENMTKGKRKEMKKEMIEEMIEKTIEKMIN